jgi:hypothetical protein
MHRRAQHQSSDLETLDYNEHDGSLDQNNKKKVDFQDNHKSTHGLPKELGFSTTEVSGQTVVNFDYGDCRWSHTDDNPNDPKLCGICGSRRRKWEPDGFVCDKNMEDHPKDKPDASVSWFIRLYSYHADSSIVDGA